MAKNNKRRKSKPRSLGKRLADDPQGTSKREWKKMGPIMKSVTAIFVAGLVSSQWANEINNLPVVGKFARPITGAASLIRGRIR